MDKYGNRFISVLKNCNIEYNIDDDVIVIYIAASKEDEKGINEVVYQTDEVFAFEVAFELDIEEEKLAILYEYINNVNCNLLKTKFVYDVDSKTIEVRHYLDKSDNLDDDMYIYNTLLPIMIYIKYGEFVDDIIEKRYTPAEVIEMINRRDMENNIE